MTETSTSVRVGLDTGDFDQYTVEGHVFTDHFPSPADGWVTQVGVRLKRKESGNVRVRLVLYDNDIGDGSITRLFQSSEQTVTSDAYQQFIADVDELRTNQGQRLGPGFWKHPSDDSVYFRATLDEGQQFRYAATPGATQAPAEFEPLFQNSFNLWAYYALEPNQAPDEGVWTAWSANGAVNASAVRFGGSLTHPEPVDSEYSQQFQIHVRRKSDNFLLYSTELEPTEQELTDGFFDRTLDLSSVLVEDEECETWYRHMDSWGVWGDWSAGNTITYSLGPTVASLTSPQAGKIDYTGESHVVGPAFLYEGSYSDSGGSALALVRVQVLNELGTIVIYDSGWVAPTASTATTWSLSQFHDDFEDGTAYSVTAQVQNAAGALSPVTGVSFHTNAAPTKPTGLSPSGGGATPISVLSCRVSDPDGDDVQEVVFEVRDADTDTHITGYPKTVVGPFASGSTVTLDIAPDVAFGTNISWRVRAWDEYIGSIHSNYETFTYAAVPLVIMQAPATFTNLIKQPSAEHDPVEEGLSTYWTDVLGNATNAVTRVADADAFVGDYVWEMTNDGAAGGDYVRRTEAETIDTSLGAVVLLNLKKMSGTGNHSLQVLCYNASDTLVGTRTPTGGEWADLNDTDPDITWETYGGYLDASWPVGTTKVRLALVRSDIAVSDPGSVVRFDGVRFYQLAVAALDGLSDEWFGYLDGDREGFGDSGDYVWEGVAGDSHSTGPAVLYHPSTTIQFSYFSASSSPKLKDILEIDRKSGSSWTRVHTSAWVTSARTEILLPVSAIANEGRYRARVRVEDSSGSGLIGAASWVEFDTDFLGPDLLAIRAVEEDEENANFRIAFDASDVPAADHIETQLAVYPVGQPRLVVAKFTDPSATQFTYDAPLSGIPYVVEIRQIVNEVYGTSESRWFTVQATVDYRKWHLKPLDALTTDSVAFDVWADVEPEDDRVKPVESMRAWMEEKPTHYVSPSDYDRGTVPVQILARDNDKLSKIQKIRDLVGRKCILLSTVPEEKRFVTVLAAPRRLARRPFYANFDVVWEEVDHTEDALAEDDG